MKIALINPPQPLEELGSAFKGGVGYILPYHLVCLATYLETKGYDVKIWDCVAEEKSMQDIEDIFVKENYDVVGLTSFTINIQRAYDVAKTAKKINPETKVVLGGVHATVCSEQCLEECDEIDFTVVGQGELVFSDMLRAFEGDGSIFEIPNVSYREGDAILSTPRWSHFIDIEDLPHPNYTLVDLVNYKPHAGNFKLLPTYSFYASRGCPYPCTFCGASFTVGKKVRYKSVDKAVEEIRILKEEHGTRGLIFQDSTFTIKRKWVVAFCEALIKADLGVIWTANSRADTVDAELLQLMKAAGCYQVLMGIESGNQQSLDLMKKRVTVEQNLKGAHLVAEAGLDLSASFIIGLPGETIEHVNETIDFATKLPSRLVSFYLPVPYPGTELYDQCADGLREDASWSEYTSRHFQNPVYFNPNFTKEEFLNLVDYAYYRYYCNVNGVRRIVSSIRSFDELKDVRVMLDDIINRWETFDPSLFYKDGMEKKSLNL